MRDRKSFQQSTFSGMLLNSHAAPQRTSSTMKEARSTKRCLLISLAIFSVAQHDFTLPHHRFLIRVYPCLSAVRFCLCESPCLRASVVGFAFPDPRCSAFIRGKGLSLR